jgi:hypothetical protein
MVEVMKGKKKGKKMIEGRLCQRMMVNVSFSMMKSDRRNFNDACIEINKTKFI